MTPSSESPLHDIERVGPDEDGAVEYLVDTFIVEGQRQQVWIRVMPEGDAWHNAAVFRRDGKLSPMDAWTTGLDWHLTPEAAVSRALELDESEWLELYERALKPRPPII